MLQLPCISHFLKKSIRMPFSKAMNGASVSAQQIRKFQDRISFHNFFPCLLPTWRQIFKKQEPIWRNSVESIMKVCKSWNLYAKEKMALATWLVWTLKLCINKGIGYFGLGLTQFKSRFAIIWIASYLKLHLKKKLVPASFNFA